MFLLYRDVEPILQGNKNMGENRGTKFGRPTRSGIGPTVTGPMGGKGGKFVSLF